MSPGVPGRDPPGVLGLIGSTSCLLFTLFIAMQAKIKENPDVGFGAETTKRWYLHLVLSH
jgi:hypothetical protein